ncbi:MAG: hypothetical protein P8Y36_06640 [Alphaproteobacteria bacterium]
MSVLDTIGGALGLGGGGSSGGGDVQQTIAAMEKIAKEMREMTLASAKQNKITSEAQLLAQVMAQGGSAAKAASRPS